MVTSFNSLFSYTVPLFIFGSSFGISLSFIDGEAVNSVDCAWSGMAAGTFNTFRIAGESIFIPFLGLIASTFSQHSSGFYAPTLYAMNMTLMTVSLVCAFFSFCIIRTMRNQKSEIFA